MQHGHGGAHGSVGLGRMSGQWVRGWSADPVRRHQAVHSFILVAAALPPRNHK